MGQAPFFVDSEAIVLTRNGVWLSDGIEIDHEPTRRLFAKSLVREGDGYLLAIGRERKRITVEDTPYFVIGLSGDRASGFTLRLNDETTEKLDPAGLRYRPGRLTAALGRGAEAKFLSAPYFELLQGLQEDETSYFLRIGGKRIDLAPSERNPR